MPVVIGIRIRKTKEIASYLSGEMDIAVGDTCIVETENALEWGTVVVPEKMIERGKEKYFRVVRKTTQQDCQKVKENNLRNKEAFIKVKKKVEDNKLNMKLVSVDYTFDRNKLFVYYTADGRIDFRELIKDLGTLLKTRIQMVQIGVRDEAKMIGGYGPCGREMCCCTFLKDFKPVSIDMAKEQDLSLNPHKISGICGRLMCCLAYEEEFYHECRKELPEVDAKVNTPDGAAVVKAVNVMSKEITVEYPDGVTKKLPVEQLSHGLFKLKFKK